MLRASHRLYSSAKDVQPTGSTRIALAKGPELRYLREHYGQVAIYLLRALLRQCTYLPDAEARRYIHFHIISRFRDYCPRLRPGSKPKPLEVTTVDKRIPSLLHDGKRNLKVLIRANDGHLDELHKVLATTYGRRGKRKHELLQALKVKDNPDDMEAVSRISNPPDVQNTKPQLTERMVALIRSQKAQKDLGFDTKLLRHMKPMIEKENAWARPMPLKRVNNQTKVWFAKTLDAIQPPLPEHEWHKLGDFATGRAKWEGPVPRRKQGTVREGRMEEAEEGLHTFAGWEFSKKKDPMEGTAHNLTHRYMRRHWQRIHAKCPMMTWDTESKRWNVQWGNIQEEKETVLSPHQEEDLSLFEGVDESGSPELGS